MNGRNSERRFIGRAGVASGTRGVDRCYDAAFSATTTSRPDQC